MAKKESRLITFLIIVVGIALIASVTHATEWTNKRPRGGCVITEVFVDHAPDPITATIYGKNFKCKKLIVTLGEYVDPLYIQECSADSDEMTVELPSGILAGDYMLTIRTADTSLYWNTRKPRRG